MGLIKKILVLVRLDMLIFSANFVKIQKYTWDIVISVTINIDTIITVNVVLQKNVSYIGSKVTKSGRCDKETKN